MLGQEFTICPTCQTEHEADYSSQTPEEVDRQWEDKVLEEARRIIKSRNQEAEKMDSAFAGKMTDGVAEELEELAELVGSQSLETLAVKTWLHQAARAVRERKLTRAGVLFGKIVLKKGFTMLSPHLTGLANRLDETIN